VFGGHPPKLRRIVKSLQKVYEKYADWTGGDKGTNHSYIDVYEKEMSKLKNISLLEIGVQFGHSIKMWEEYFENSWIGGIDITLQYLSFPELENIFLCDGTNKSQVNKILKNKKFDYIIDDASHTLQDQISSFDIFYPKLKVGGKYFIEDIASDNNLKKIKNHLLEKNIESFKLYDLRYVKNRFDDIMIVVTK
jgi:cephalosporin hydroxylase